MDDIDLWEINEAFASVALRYMKDLGVNHEVTNVVGGAIAVGHPVGATGGVWWRRATSSNAATPSAPAIALRRRHGYLHHHRARQRLRELKNHEL